jgi:hypothetical protein
MAALNPDRVWERPNYDSTAINEQEDALDAQSGASSETASEALETSDEEHIDSTIPEPGSHFKDEEGKCDLNDRNELQREDFDSIRPMDQKCGEQNAQHNGNF